MSGVVRLTVRGKVCVSQGGGRTRGLASGRLAPVVPAQGRDRGRFEKWQDIHQGGPDVILMMRDGHAAGTGDDDDDDDDDAPLTCSRRAE